MSAVHHEYLQEALDPLVICDEFMDISSAPLVLNRNFVYTGERILYITPVLIGRDTRASESKFLDSSIAVSTYNTRSKIHLSPVQLSSSRLWCTHDLVVTTSVKPISSSEETGCCGLVFGRVRSLYSRRQKTNLWFHVIVPDYFDSEGRASFGESAIVDGAFPLVLVKRLSDDRIVYRVNRSILLCHLSAALNVTSTTAP